MMFDDSKKWQISELYKLALQHFDAFDKSEFNTTKCRLLDRELMGECDRYFVCSDCPQKIIAMYRGTSCCISNDEPREIYAVWSAINEFNKIQSDRIEEFKETPEKLEDLLGSG